MMALEKRKVMVTGGAGFIGSHLVDALAAAGNEVVVVDNLSAGKMANLENARGRVEFVRGDIRDFGLLEKTAVGCDFVFHLAAMVSVPQTVREPLEASHINDTGTLNVFEAARRNGAERVVFSSSCAVYGDLPGLPKREDMPLKPQSPYAVQKLTGENYAGVYSDLYGLETVCLRYFNVFGPRQDPSSPYSGVISIFMSKAAKKQAPVIHGDGRQTRDFVFVSDVVRANMLAATAEKAAGETFNVGTGVQISVNRLWRLICEINEIRISAVYGPPRAGDIQNSEADLRKTKKIMNFSPRYSIGDGLKITNEWYGKQ